MKLGQQFLNTLYLYGYILHLETDRVLLLTKLLPNYYAMVKYKINCYKIGNDGKFAALF